MKFTVDYPIVLPGYDPALVGAEGMTTVARAVEQHGFDAIAFSEHPAPSAKWIAAGGHESLDQTSALAFCAAVTSSVRLMTYLTVLPYHNPFQLAKALTTVDLLSGGRLTVVAGGGYLKGEFMALGVDPSRRNERFDEALEVLRGVWTSPAFTHEGEFFSGRGVASLPAPAQAGGPPVLIGGNSGRARERAARSQGWSPLLLGDAAAANSRTAGIESIDALAGKIAEVKSRALEEQGPGASTTIQVHSAQTGFMSSGGSVEEHRDHLGQLTAAGVDSFVVRPPGDSATRTVDALQEYAETFIN